MNPIRKILLYFTIIQPPKPMRACYRIDGVLYESRVTEFSADYYIICSGPHAGNLLHKLDVIKLK